MKIRLLAESDDRSQFHSGDPDLDRFFVRFAGQNQFRHQIGVTYVAVEDERIVGFLTVTPGTVEIESLPSAARKGFPKYPLPVLRLARLAVDRSAQGVGVGAALLRFVFGLAMRLSTDFGCVGVLVDAKQGAVAFYEKYGFIHAEVQEGALDVRPRPHPMFISVRKVRASVG